MADENQELRHVNWTELFSFTQIFKGFRLAIHPSKMILALATVVLVVLIGWLMDRVWYQAGGRAQVGDVYRYYQAPSEAVYKKEIETDLKTRQEQLAQWYAASVQEAHTLAPVIYRLRREAAGGDSLFIVAFVDAANRARQGQKVDTVTLDQARQQVQQDTSDVWERYERNVKDMLGRAGDRAREARDKAREQLRNLGRSEAETAERRIQEDQRALERALLGIRIEALDTRQRQVFGMGIAAALWEYEQECFDNAVRSVVRGNLFGGFDRLIYERGRPGVAFGEAPRALRFDASTDDPQGVGFFAWAVLVLWGLVWLVFTHWLYALVFLLAALAVWAVLGGAIARIAALHAAREEKISMAQALRFSVGKFFSFFTAPLIPLAIVLVLGLLMGLVGLVMMIPIVDIILSILGALGLILGAVVAFLAIGLLAGCPLMYPTIAVEGSDSFDAISRSFSYVFSRPWRYGLYTIVAVVYGSVCYLFVRLFAFLLLSAARLFLGHGFFGGGLSWSDASDLGEGASKLDLLWAPPTFDDLARGVNFSAMSRIQSMAALFVNLWIYLVAGLVMAFALSYFISAFTTIYYLLRRKVDATDLDDVYVEEPETTEEMPAAAPGEEAAAPPAEPPTAPPAGPDEPPPAGSTPPA